MDSHSSTLQGPICSLPFSRFFKDVSPYALTKEVPFSPPLPFGRSYSCYLLEMTPYYSSFASSFEYGDGCPCLAFYWQIVLLLLVLSKFLSFSFIFLHVLPLLLKSVHAMVMPVLEASVSFITKFVTLGV
ncbi:hypothetical protein VNO77_25494 [Canavalia gladiata]|uniref:Uncharacterized protein n=1 Tax=Canavalia gladiata TaxID=3824 RepID=A0AAN9L8R6_CANGL